MCHGRVLEVAGADECVGVCERVGELGGCCGAFLYGVVGAGGGDLGPASDLYWALWGYGGLLVGFAQGGGEEVGVGLG